MRQEIEAYVGSLGLDAYLVGGAVRDELLGLDSKDADFLVPGVDTDGLKRALEPHGRVEDLVVAGRLVGVRLHPRDAKIRGLARSGIEFAPPRAERSTGPGRHDFEIVADATLSVEDDMRRRDFTVNAMARRLRTGKVDYYGDSYATYFGQVFTARYHRMLRSVTLDAAYPVVEANPFYPLAVRAAHRGFNRACDRSLACRHATYGTSWRRIGAAPFKEALYGAA